MTVRNTDPDSSHKSAVAFRKHISKVDVRILEVVRSSGPHGRTQSEVVDGIPEYKPGSITPRFTRLVRNRQLVLIPLGNTKPTKRCPGGRPRYITRFDKETKRNVNVYWAPEFAPVRQAAA
jgi:hypothetical protein